jgi:hypothetical protein
VKDSDVFPTKIFNGIKISAKGFLGYADGPHSAEALPKSLWNFGTLKGIFYG